MNKDTIKLLIVDDEVEFATALAERLELRGFLPTTAGYGLEGLEELATSSPDVVLLDLKMPDMSGVEVLDNIKANYPAVEVIMLTGHGTVSGGTDCIERGAFDFIMKPVDLAELMEKIKAAYQKKMSASQTS